MNSTVFAVAVISSVIGAIFGVLVKHILDMRGYDQVCRWYVEESEKVDERDKVIKDLQNEINKLHQALAVQSLRKITLKPMSDSDRDRIMNSLKELNCTPTFLDVNDLPKHFNDDIDFGGKF